jgi:hypothetical protein
MIVFSIIAFTALVFINAGIIHGLGYNQTTDEKAKAVFWGLMIEFYSLGALIVCVFGFGVPIFVCGTIMNVFSVMKR